MDPLSALAIVAAVFQLVDFGGRLLKKGWVQYQGAVNEREATELRDMAGNLSALLNMGSRKSGGSLHEKHDTAAEIELRRLCDECNSITSEFQDIVSRNKPYGKSKSRNFLQGPWNTPKASDLKERLAQIKDQVITAVLFCLWEESKQAGQREIRFSKQLREITYVLDKVGNSLKPEKATEISSRESSYEHSLELGELDGSVNATIETFTACSVSPGEIRKALNDTLHGEFPIARKIRSELIECLWARGWKSQTRIAGFDNTSSVLRRDIVKAIRRSLHFEAIKARENAVIDSFMKTYSWIFQKEPNIEDGRPMWPSFPEWLENTNAAQYWITGKPGSGKSTIMKYILNHGALEGHLSRWAGSLPLLVVRYYAWNSGLTLQKSLEGLKRTLLHQVLKLDPSLVQTLAPRRWAFLTALRDSTLTQPPWETWEIEEAFSSLVSQCGKSIMLAIFIDGLDEFETSPHEVTRLIQEMVTNCAQGLKLCVASRPWQEFDDAFNDIPHLHMHLLTKQDMAAFVRGKMSNNRGFLEVKQVYPEDAVNLLEAIVSKANGIFLWVSLVVRDLLISLSEGASLASLQATLEVLPSDISLLYDTIWARIPDHNLHDASFMVQVVRAAQLPVRWLLMWVADESRTTSVDLSSLPEWETWKPAAWKNLKRRLASRTRGVLEITSESYFAGAGGSVDFAHRTARDWAIQSHVWAKICSADQDGVDPYLVLLKSETILFSDKRERSLLDYSRQWWVVTRALWYGSKVRDTPQSVADLVQSLDNLNRAATNLKWEQPAYMVGHTHERWVLPGWATKFVNTFLGMTAQFAILPYVRAKVRSQPSLLCQEYSRNTLGLLENAIFGYGYYLPTSYHSLNGFSPIVPCDQRLKVVQFLLQEGVILTSVHSHLGIVPLQDLLRIAVKGDLRIPEYDEISEEGEAYLLQVTECVECRSLKSKFKSASLRVRRYLPVI